MRSADHILSLQEGMVCRGRLVNKDIQGCARDFTTLQRFKQGGFDDDPTPCAVDNAHPVFHLG